MRKLNDNHLRSSVPPRFRGSTPSACEGAKLAAQRRHDAAASAIKGCARILQAIHRPPKLVDDRDTVIRTTKFPYCYPHMSQTAPQSKGNRKVCLKRPPGGNHQISNPKWSSVLCLRDACDGSAGAECPDTSPGATSHDDVGCPFFTPQHALPWKHTRVTGREASPQETPRVRVTGR